MEKPHCLATYYVSYLFRYEWWVEVENGSLGVGISTIRWADGVVACFILNLILN